MEQILVMQVAATLTQAACGTSGASNTISPDLSDPQVRAKNLQAWETFRAYYQAIVQALADPADWPVPNIPVGSFAQNLLQSAGPALPGLVTALAPLVTSSGPLGSVATAIVSLLNNASKPTQPQLPSNIPSPGAKPATASK